MDGLNLKRVDRWTNADTYDPHYMLKLSRAKDWLGRLDRGKPDSEHIYIKPRRYGDK